MDKLTLAFLATGLAVGVISGILGIGGAVLLVPILVLVFGFSQGRAQGTSIGALIPPIGVFAAIHYYRSGLLDIRASGLIALGFVFGAPNSTLDQTLLYTQKVNEMFNTFPEKANTFQITGPTFGFSGMVMKPWSARSSSAVSARFADRAWCAACSRLCAPPCHSAKKAN